jgi:DNA-binding Lrp family transcriptional regulator
LADAQASGACVRKDVGVQVPPRPLSISGRPRVRPVVHAIVLITAEPARIAALAGAIADLDGVSAAYSVAGDEDIVVIVRVSDHESLADLVTGSIAAQPGVLRTRTLIAFRVYSRADLESI